MADATYAPLGPWWTLDGPSLRLPNDEGEYVSVWMAGQGPLLVLVPRTGSGVDCWLPLLPLLGDHFTLIATDSGTDAVDLVAVLRGTGARLLLADGDGADCAFEVMAASAEPLRALLHACGRSSEDGGVGVSEVHRIGAADDLLADHAEAVAAAVRAALIRRDQPRDQDAERESHV